MSHLLYCLALAAVFCGAQAQTLILTPPSVFVAVGSTYSVVCSCDCTNILRFTFNDQTTVPSTTRYNTTAGQSQATLTVTNVQVNDASPFVQVACQAVGGTSTPVGVTVFASSVTNYTAEIGSTKTATLTVNILALNNALISGSWYRGAGPNGTQLSNSSSYSIVTTVVNITGAQYTYNVTYQLTITKPDLSQAGPYFVLLIQPQSVYVNAYLNTLPVLSFEPAPDGGRSYSIYDGSTFNISCLAQGYPLPSGVSWTVDFENDQPSVNAAVWPRATLAPNRLSQTNGSIQIVDIDYTDRATFYCYAQSAFGNSTLGYLVRVKDPLAALWPAIGVVVEILVLAAIIILYEKYKDRCSEGSDDDDNHVDAGPGHLDTHALTTPSGVELRQRTAHP